MSNDESNANRILAFSQPEDRIAQGVRWAAARDAVGRNSTTGRLPTSAEINAEIEAEINEVMRLGEQLDRKEGGREPSFHTGLAITMAAASIPISAVLFLVWLALR